MSAPTREERAKLRELAAAATPAPWQEDRDVDRRAIDSPTRAQSVAYVCYGDAIHPDEAAANRDLTIAARNAIVPLLDALEEAEAYTEASRETFDDAMAEFVAAKRERDEAQALAASLADRLVASSARVDELAAQAETAERERDAALAHAATLADALRSLDGYIAERGMLDDWTIADAAFCVAATRRALVTTPERAGASFVQMRAALEAADEWLDDLGCDCGEDEPGTCAYCLVRAALTATPETGGAK